MVNPAEREIGWHPFPAISVTSGEKGVLRGIRGYLKNSNTDKLNPNISVPIDKDIIVGAGFFIGLIALLFTGLICMEFPLILEWFAHKRESENEKLQLENENLKLKLELQEKQSQRDNDD